MKRMLLAVLGAAGLSGCYAEATYVPPQGGYVTATVPYGEPPPVSVSVAPPPPRYEVPLSCGYGSAYAPGQWDWNGSWYWTAGYCTPVRAGYVYVAPSYSGGIYLRGHWAAGGGGTYVPPPAPTYNRGTYVPPPAPTYNRGTYVPSPAPTYNRGTYVPPPAPAHRGDYVPPPAPRY